MRKIEIVRSIQTWKVAPTYKQIPKFNVDHEDLLSRNFRIWKHVLEFLEVNKRIKFDLSRESLIQVLNRVEKEDERNIQVRLTMAEFWGETEVWTTWGKLTKMAVMKPKKMEDCYDLRKWKLLMIYKEHQKGVIELSVSSALGELDHILAWYALWRRWPLHYSCWEWACNIPLRDVVEPTRMAEIGYSTTYKRYWSYVEEVQGSGYPMVDNDIDWSGEHICVWEHRNHTESIATYIPRVKRAKRTLP